MVDLWVKQAIWQDPLTVEVYASYRAAIISTNNAVGVHARHEPDGEVGENGRVVSLIDQ